MKGIFRLWSTTVILWFLVQIHTRWDQIRQPLDAHDWDRAIAYGLEKYGLCRYGGLFDCGGSAVGWLDFYQRRLLEQDLQLLLVFLVAPAIYSALLLALQWIVSGFVKR